MEELLRRKEVEKITALSCGTIYRLIKVEDFPKPIKMGGGSVRWHKKEIEVWIAERPRAGTKAN
ncbi:MAG: AlpA family phage regulatory protein [Gammaproteobacteria bacterium]|nr:AlpA family phage regulatory protein [Gammaproteobacteria bacterium]